MDSLLFQTFSLLFLRRLLSFVIQPSLSYRLHFSSLLIFLLELVSVMRTDICFFTMVCKSEISGGFEGDIRYILQGVPWSAVVCFERFPCTGSWSGNI